MGRRRSILRGRRILSREKLFFLVCLGHVVVDDVVEEVWYVVVALGRTLVWVVDRGRDGRLVRVAVGLLGGALAQTHAASAAEDELRGSDVGEVGSEAAGVTPADPPRG